MLMLISVAITCILMLFLAFLYFKTAQAIEREDINDAITRFQRVKNKNESAPLADD